MPFPASRSKQSMSQNIQNLLNIKETEVVIGLQLLLDCSCYWATVVIGLQLLLGYSCYWATVVIGLQLLLDYSCYWTTVPRQNSRGERFYEL